MIDKAEPAAATLVPAPDADKFAAAIFAGDRRALARAITLIESSRPDHRDAADRLLERLLPRTGKAVRLGISGAPGVGKSTLIEAFGLFLIERGHRPAVLAIDPSSPLTGGSILGDKTRMEELARNPQAYIRPSPSSGTLGGVARRTREAGLICEAAGYDVIIVETVGVGQSEIAVADMVDLFILILPPAGGDELQGIKKGIVELAEIIVINKADGEFKPAAGRAAAEYGAAVQMLRPVHPDWIAPVIQVSALERSGLDALWEATSRFLSSFGAERLATRRARQAVAWMWREIDAGLRAALAEDGCAAARLPALEAKVSQGIVSPVAAARDVLLTFLGQRPSEP